MFRHMHISRETSVLHEIMIVRFQLTGNWQTLSKDGPLHLVNNIMFRPFAFCLRPMTLAPFLDFAQLSGVPTTSFAHCFHVYQLTALNITLYLRSADKVGRPFCCCIVFSFLFLFKVSDFSRKPFCFRSFIIIFILFLSHFLRSAISLPFLIGSFSYLASW